jgi:hypothetical protein
MSDEKPEKVKITYARAVVYDLYFSSLSLLHKMIIMFFQDWIVALMIYFMLNFVLDYYRIQFHVVPIVVFFVLYLLDVVVYLLR